MAAGLVAAFAASFAACGGDPIYTYQGQRFDPAKGCLDRPTALDVVEGPTEPREDRTLDREVELPGQTGRPVIVHPGDVVHGDRDGVLVVPAEHLPRLVHDVEITDAIERRMREQIDAGVDRQVVYETNPRFAHVRRVVS